jgi:hypothetical protein
MLRNLYGYGMDGTTQAQGKGREMVFFTHRQYVSFKRYLFKLQDIVAAQKIDWMDIAKERKRYLERWAGAYMNTDVTAAMLEGYSRHITNGVFKDPTGTIVKKQYHPNFWIWDDGGSFATNTPSYSTDSDTYRDAIIAKLGDLTSSDTFDTNTLEALNPLLSQKDLQPYIVDGREIYPLIISTSQEKTLRQDEVFKDAVSRGMPRGYDNPMFNSASYVWGKFVIYVNDVICRIAYADTGILDFFKYSGGVLIEGDEELSGTYEKVQTPGANQHGCCALILGASSLAYAPYQDWEFPEMETKDFGMVREMAIQAFYGLSRLDFRDTFNIADSTQIAEPQSAVVVTYV